jgi:hypothetical protein
MAVEFYNVKKKKKVSIDDSSIEKVKYERETKTGKTQIRYAFKAKDDDGTSLTKFCSESDWNNL